MPQVRYLGFTVGEGNFDGDRSDGDARFLVFAEPMPVGSMIEVDGLRQRITRVEEGANGGFWVLPEGGKRAAPVQVEPETTVPSAPPVEMTAEPEGPEDGAPEAIGDATAEAAPEPTSDEPSSGGRSKKKRKNRKTVVGR
jgi:hypothetical protein